MEIELSAAEVRLIVSLLERHEQTVMAGMTGEVQPWERKLLNRITRLHDKLLGQIYGGVYGGRGQRRDGAVR